METLLASLGLDDTARIVVMTQSAIHIIIILIGAWLLKLLANKGIRSLRTYMAEHRHNHHEKQRLETLGRVFRYVANVLITAVTGMLVFTKLGISIAPILATAGVLGLAIGFGAQSLVKDYFSGLFLLLEDQIRQGDVIQAGGKAGLVEDITLRHMRLRDYDGNVHFVPNGHIDTVTNMTRDFAYAVIDVGVAYRENVDEVISIIREVGHELQADEKFGKLILEDVDIAGVDDWTDSAVVIRLRFKVVPIEQWTVRREFLRRLKIAFDAHGIEIPYPHLTVYAGQNKDGTAPPLRLVTESA